MKATIVYDEADILRIVTEHAAKMYPDKVGHGRIEREKKLVGYQLDEHYETVTKIVFELKIDE